MADYRLRTTDIVVYPVDKSPLHHNAIRVQLAGDPDGGYFIRLEQEDQAIELDPEELPLVVEAARRLLKGDIPAELEATE